jgi:hypothetical protein
MPTMGQRRHAGSLCSIGTGRRVALIVRYLHVERTRIVGQYRLEVMLTHASHNTTHPKSSAGTSDPVGCTDSSRSDSGLSTGRSGAISVNASDAAGITSCDTAATRHAM